MLFEILRRSAGWYKLFLIVHSPHIQNTKPSMHSLNMELDLQSLFGLHVQCALHSCTHWLRLRPQAETPQPPPISPIWAHIRHLFVTSCFDVFVCKELYRSIWLKNWSLAGHSLAGKLMCWQRAWYPSQHSAIHEGNTDAWGEVQLRRLSMKIWRIS